MSDVVACNALMVTVSSVTEICRDGTKILRSSLVQHHRHCQRNLYRIKFYSGSKVSLSTGSYEDQGHIAYSMYGHAKWNVTNCDVHTSTSV